MKRALTATAVSAAVLLGGVACSSSSTNEAATTTTTASKKSFEISTEDGQVSLSLDGKLPPGWPSAFPVPNGAQPAGSGSLGGSSTTVLVGVFTAPGSPEDAYGFYTSQSSLTVESKSSIGSGDRYVGTVKFSGSDTGRVTVLPRDGQTYIVVVLETAGTGSTGTTGTARTGTTVAATKSG